MKRASKDIRNAVLLTAMVLSASLSVIGAFTQQAAADCTRNVSYYYKIKTVVTYSSGQSVAGSDTINFAAGGSANAPKVSGSSTQATYETSTQSNSGACNVPPPQVTANSQLTGKSVTCAGSVNQSAPAVCTITGAFNSSGNPGGPPQPSNSAPTCEGTLGPLGWILCGIFDLVGGATQWILTNIIQPFLVTTPISTNPSDPSYAVWSNFRIYGDVFLIFALLVIVFGQSIGGGMVDAYTAKKVLPRLLIAAILINLSLYIVALLVDLTNILGEGIGNLLTQPLRQGGNWSFQISGTQIAGVFSVGLIGLLASAGTVIGVVSALIFGGVATAGAAFMSIFFILLPMFLAVIAVFVTLVIRKGIILMLLLISPVAFALYCLPNTEKYFRKWWDALVKTLLVYPIVMAVFAVADLLSVTILNANNVSAKNLQDSNWAASHAGSILAVVIAFVAQFLPLFLIPFAFRLAGGLLGRVHDFATGAKDRVNKLSEGRRQHEQQKFHGQTLQGRQRIYAGLQNTKLGESSKFGRGLKRFAAQRVGGYNIEAASSAERARVGKEVNDQIATGMDGEIRGLSVNKKWALAANADGSSKEGDQWRWATDADGNRTGGREFKTLGGAWVSEADVDQGHSRWGRNTYAQQASLAYEMRKAQTEADIQNVAENYANVATGDGGWGMNNQQAGGAWIGAAFEHQNKHLEYKYTNWQNGEFKGAVAEGAASTGAKGFVDEVYEQRGNYGMSQMSSNTIRRLQTAYHEAERAGDIDTKQKIAAIAETGMHELGGAGIAGMEGERPVQAEGGGRARQASTPGAAHVAERWVELAKTAKANGVDGPSVYEKAPGFARTTTTNSQGQTVPGRVTDPGRYRTPEHYEDSGGGSYRGNETQQK